MASRAAHPQKAVFQAPALQIGRKLLGLWEGQGEHRAVFWTDLNGKLATDAPEISGYSHSLDRSRAAHIRETHGKEATEAQRNQIAVTEGDLARIPDIVTGYDAVDANVPIRNEQGAQQLRGVVFVKRYEDATVVYTGLVSQKRQNVRGATMWKYPPTVDAQTALKRAAANLTSETLGGMDDSIAREGEYNQSAFDGSETGNTPVGDLTEIEVDGVTRPALNSAGRPIHPTQEGIRNFWRWFGDSKVVDDQGRPLVVYHGTDQDITEFSHAGESTGDDITAASYLGYFFTPEARYAEDYARYAAGRFGNETIYPVTTVRLN